ncbi:MAG: hypothetical protein ABIS29_01200 [Vicinamibacterales bacterium]
MNAWPIRFAAALTGVHVATARGQGWAGLRNGELLSRMRAAEFTALVTVDRNLAYQQNVAAAGVVVLVMHARTNRLPDLLPLAAKVLAALESTVPGEIVRVAA